MGTGYTRNDTSGNIANGKVIDATDLDGEFDAIVTAFSTSGHTHDGTAAEGGKVTKLLGTSLTLGDGTAGTDITVTFDGETSDGVLVWMEDEDYFQFNDDILMNTSEKLQFRDTGIYISSNADGDLDIVSDGTAVDSINIESAGGITLDAGTAASGVIFEDDGTEMLRIYNSSSDVYIEAKVSNKDMYIRGNDNGTPVNAITLDMSEAGAATFAGGITSTAVANTLGATSFNEANITNVGNIALDSITADGSTITITGNTTFVDGAYNFNIASHDGSNGLQLGGTLVTATAAELNIIDGGTSAASTTVADADRVVFNDGGTMKQVAVTDLAAYFDDEITAMPNLVTTAATTVGALNSGSITSGFGTIDTGSSNITTTGTVTGGTVAGTLSTAAQTNITSVGALGGGSITSGFGNIDTGSSTITTTGLISGGSLDIDDVLINGTTIGHTDDTDLITLADGVVTVAGEISVTTLDIGGTNVGSTAGELNLLDGSNKSTSSITIADADAFIVIDGNTTKQIPASDIATYATGSTGQLSTGTENVAIGGSALANITSDAVRNVAFGQEAGNDITSGDLNVAVGYQALQSATTDQQHVAVGLGALNSTNEATSGDGHNGNVGIGSYAGYTNVTGRFQTFVGTHSGKYIIGGYNTSVGHQALEGVHLGGTTSDVQQCVAVGYNSMSAITTGDSNTAVGASSGSGITTGENNVCIGTSAGSGVTTASNSIYVGYQSGTNSTTSDHSIFIGTTAGYGGTSSTNLTGNNNIGVGSSTGYYLTTGASNTMVGYAAGSTITTGSVNTCLGNDAEPSSATASGEFTLGDSNVSTLRCNDTSISSLSDERDKTDIVDSSYGLDFINTIRPVQFKWDRRDLAKGDKTAVNNGKTRLGFLAQEFQKAMPNEENETLNLVHENNSERLETKMGNLIPILTKALQELSAKNDALEARIKTLAG